MSLLPLEQGFTESSGCPTPSWSLDGGILQFRECAGLNTNYLMYDNLFGGTTTTAQLDVRMRVLDYIGYPFHVCLAKGSAGGWYYKIDYEDLGDDAYHDVTFYVDFVGNTASVYVDGVEIESPHLESWPYRNAFLMGDGDTYGTWGNVDIASLTITVDLDGPVENERRTWSSIKQMYH
jgi:hypothetical protein